MQKSKTISRRHLLKRSASAVAAFTIVPCDVLGGPNRTPPSETLTAGLIGCGGQGGEDLNTYIRAPGGDYKLLAACDVDKGRLANAKKKFGEHVKLYTDWRRVIERKDIDVVSIATPPHWHALMCIAAAQAGKDILCEKPMTRFIAEGRAVVKAVKRYGRVFQIGTSGRFGAYKSSRSRTIHKIMRSGLLRHCPAVYIKKGGFPVLRYCGKVDLKPEPVPAHLDWDMYCGPAPLHCGRTTPIASAGAIATTGTTRAGALLTLLSTMWTPSSGSTARTTPVPSRWRPALHRRTPMPVVSGRG